MNTNIRPGMPVLSSDGFALGHVLSVDADGFVVAGGGMVHGDHRVVPGEVSGIFAGEIYLRKRAADVAAMGPEAPAPML